MGTCKFGDAICSNETEFQLYVVVKQSEALGSHGDKSEGRAGKERIAESAE